MDYFVQSGSQERCQQKGSAVLSLYNGKGPRSECNSYRPITLLSVQAKYLSMSSSPDLTLCFRNIDDLTSLDLLVVAPCWMQSWHNVCWRKSIGNFNSHCKSHSWIWRQWTFSSVDRTALLKAMRSIGVLSVLLDLIIDLHTATSAGVRLAVRLSTSFVSTSAVRQGCVLAPALFCRTLDFIMEHVSHKVSIQVSQHSFTDTDYADDAILLVDKEENFCTALSASLIQVQSTCLLDQKKNRESWSGVDAISSDSNGNIVNPVQECTYLGSLQSLRTRIHSAFWSCTQCNKKTGLSGVRVTSAPHKDLHILHVHPTRITLWFRKSDSYRNRLEKTRLLSYAVSATNLTHQLAWLQWRSSKPYWPTCSLIHCSQKTKTRSFRPCCQTLTHRTSQSDPSNLQQGKRRRATIAGMETCLWSATYQLDSPDLLWHRCHTDQGPVTLKLIALVSVSKYPAHTQQLCKNWTQWLG